VNDGKMVLMIRYYTVLRVHTAVCDRLSDRIHSLRLSNELRGVTGMLKRKKEKRNQI
jgi:hypothetical protein